MVAHVARPGVGESLSRDRRAETTPCLFGNADFATTAHSDRTGELTPPKEAPNRLFLARNDGRPGDPASIVMSIVMSGMAKLTTSQGTGVNRTEMHRSVRGATELLQQEVGQAGRISLPATVTLTAAASANSSAESVTVSSTSGLYVGMYLDVLPDTASKRELRDHPAGGREHRHEHDYSVKLHLCAHQRRSIDRFRLARYRHDPASRAFLRHSQLPFLNRYAHDVRSVCVRFHL